MLLVQVRVPEPFRRCVGLPRRCSDVVFQRCGDAALIVDFHYWHADKEIAIANRVGHEVMCACSKSTYPPIAARTLIRLESPQCIPHGVVRKVTIFKGFLRTRRPEFCHQPAERAPRSGESISPQSQVRALTRW